MTPQPIDNYRLTSLEEPTDEMLAQLMREAAEEAKQKKVAERFVVVSRTKPSPAHVQRSVVTFPIANIVTVFDYIRVKRYIALFPIPVNLSNWRREAPLPFNSISTGLFMSSGNCINALLFVAPVLSLISPIT